MKDLRKKVLCVLLVAFMVMSTMPPFNGISFALSEGENESAEAVTEIQPEELQESDSALDDEQPAADDEASEVEINIDVTDPEIVSEDEPEEEPEVESETNPENEPVEEPEIESEINSENEPEEEPEVESETNPENEPVEEPEVESETNPENEPVEEPEVESETNPENEPVEEPEVESEENPEIIIESEECTLIQKSALANQNGSPLKAAPTHNVELTGTSSITVIQGSEFKFFETDNINITTSNGDTFQYRVIVSDIQVPAGGSYTWDGTNYEKSDGASISFVNADAGKTYKITYQVQYQDPDDNNEWKDREGVSHTTEITISPGATYDYVTGDVACVKDNLKLVVLADGTAPWDGDDKPGNDSNDKNLIVRTFDQVSYRAEYQTDTNLGKDVYFKNAYLWVEITLPCTREKASIAQVPTEAIVAKAPYEIQVGDETHTVYTYYYKRKEHIDSSGHLNHALPEIGGFEFTMQVYNAKDGDTVKPKVGMAVCWTKVDQNGNAVVDSKGNLVVEKPYTAATPGNGVYDYPRYAEGPDIRITAKAGFNVRIHSLASTKSAKVHNFDATTNTDAPNYGIGNVYGRGIIFGVRVCLNSGIEAKGIRGMELPDGNDITFELEMGASIANNPVDVPLVWDVSSRGRSMEYGRGSNGSYTSPSHLAYTPADMKKAKGTAFTTPSNGEQRVSVWNGGDWTLEQQPNGKVKVTIKNYVVNPFWFPNGYNSSQTSSARAYLNNGKAGDYKYGVFSAKRLYMVVPFGSNITDTARDKIDYLSEGDLENGYYYLNAYGLASGDISISIRDKNLDITSVSGKNSLDPSLGNDNGQTIYTDANDLLTGKVKLARSGTLSSRAVRYSYNGTTANTRDATGKELAVMNGKDALMPGSKVQFFAPVSYTHRDNYEDEWLRAGQVLVKFDDEFLTPTTALPSNANYMFAGKAGGWASDEEMKKTGMEELTYFHTMEELETAGMKCVGILRETIDTGEPKADVGQGFGIRINDLLLTKDPAYYNKVCMLTMQVKLWRQAEYDAIVELNGEFPLYRNGIPQGKTVEDYISEEYGVEKSEVKPWRDDLNAKNNLGYRKAYYDEDGYHEGSGTEPDWGDSLYVIPYRVAINNYVEQKDGPNSTNPVEFSLENGENIADFCLESRFVLPEGFEETELSNATTTVTITNVLPKGLEYILDSAYIGGTWKKNALNAGGHGTVVDYIEQRNPEIIERADGTTVLTWVLENVPIGDNDALPKIHFAAYIDEDIDKTTTWENEGRVKSTEDNRPADARNGNLDNAKISVSPSNSLIVKKQADKYFHDRDDEITWTLRWKNKSNGAYANKVLMDVLPYDGDSNGSKIAKGYEIKLIKYEFLNGANASGFNFYYTTDKGARSGDAFAEEFPYEEFVGNNPTINDVEWKLGGIGADGTPNMNLKEEIVAFALVGDMPGKAEVRATVTIKPNDTKGGDKYVNTISADSLRQTSQTQIVERGISGIAWREKGEPDGQRDASEIPGQGGVKVVLKMLNASGEWEEYAVTTTDKSGRYSFDDLPSGKFRVEFVNEDFDLSVFRATEQKKEGVSEHVNSDAKALYDEKVFAVIEDIVLPSAADMTTSRYYRENLDLGIWQPDLTVTKTLDLSALEDEEAASKEKDREFLFRLTVPNAEDGIEYQMYDAQDERIGAVTGSELMAGFEFFLKDGEALRFENLPANGTYTLEEYDYEGNNYGYKMSLEEGSDELSDTLDQNREVKVLNTFVEPEVTEIKVSKEWKDEEASKIEGYTRPYSVTATLLKNGADETKVVLSEENDWTYTFSDLPKYEREPWPTSFDDENKEIEYEVKESLVDDESFKEVDGEKRFYIYNEDETAIGYFTYTVATDENTGDLTITNTFVPVTEEEEEEEEEPTEEEVGEVSFFVKKVDEDGAAITGNSAIFELYKEGTNDVIVAETGLEDGIATFTVKEAGRYTVKEKQAPLGYKKTTEEYTITVEDGGRVLVSEDKEANKKIFNRIFSVTFDGDWDPKTLTLSVVNEKLKGKLSLSKQVDKNVVYSGDTLNYDIIVTNISEVTMENVSVWDDIPTQLAYLSDDSNGKYDVVDGAERIHWSIGTLKAGESKTFKLSVLVKECTDKENIINVAYGSVPNAPGAPSTSGSTDVPFTTKDEAKVQVKPTPEVTPTKTATTPKVKTETKVVTSKQPKSRPKTGDTSDAGLWIVLLIMAMELIFVSLKMKANNR